MISKIKGHIVEHNQLMDALTNDKTLLGTVDKCIDMISQCLQEDKQILFCGNGGSAADSEHLAAELSGRFKKDRAPLNAEALHVNGASLTAIANDYGYEKVFARILEAKAKKGDILWCMTTSGKSENIIAALLKAKELGVHTILLTGQEGQASYQVDLHIRIPSQSTARIQEAMMLLGHIICEEVETKIFPT